MHKNLIQPVKRELHAIVKNIVVPTETTIFNENVGA